MNNGNNEVSVGEKLVKEGLTISRIENESQQVMAIQKPRDEQKVSEGMLAELEAIPEFASKAYYSIPYKNEDGGTTFVEGPSIKLSMAIARRWGNCANGARVIDDNDERILVEGVFIDYETNMRTLRQVSVSKTVWSKNTKSYFRIKPDRLNMAIQAGMSKAVRNAILASLPISIIELCFQKAKKLAIGTKVVTPKGGAPVVTGPSSTEIKAKILLAAKAFIGMGVDKKLVDAYIENSSQETDEDLLAHLRGLYNAIKDGQTTADAVFGTAEAKEEIKGPVKSENLFK
jgi:hypothetical protein